MTDCIRFLLGNELQELSGLDPQMTVLDWLRTRKRRTGSKEGCAEGDCGACTVTVGEVQDGQLRYRAFNSCIQLLATLDGKQLISVEDLASETGGRLELHPVQQAMVDQHGAQCGFCTPGFVMSLFTLYQESTSETPGRQRINECLAGNLCRCTGYAPIVRAANQSITGEPDDAFSRRRQELIEQLQQLKPDSSLHLQGHGKQFFAPHSLNELWQLLQQHPSALMIAGATDVGLWMTKQLRQFDTLVSVSRVAELNRIEHDDAEQEISIGAAVTYAQAFDVLVSGFPALRPMLSRLGAEQVRNAGTIGGNIANGSPIGDMPPALIALGARLVVSSASGRREMPLEAFFIEYGKQDLQAGECVESIRIPLPQPGQQFAVYKISKRFDQDISALCGGFRVQLKGGKITDARICFGGMAGTPLRAARAEKALLNAAWNEHTLAQACASLADDYQPLSDWRASAGYRLLVAQNLLRRFYLEASSEAPAQLAAGKTT